MHLQCDLVVRLRDHTVITHSYPNPSSFDFLDKIGTFFYSIANNRKKGKSRKNNVIDRWKKWFLYLDSRAKKCKKRRNTEPQESVLLVEDP